MCHTDQPVAALDQSFFYGCLSAVSRTTRQKTTIKDCRFRESVELYLSWRSECQGYTPPDSQYLASGYYQNVSMQMAINTRNATSAEFGRRLKRYLKHKHSLEGSQAFKLQCDIMADTYEVTDEMVLLYRRKLPSRPSYGKLEDYPHLVMPLQFEILRHFEESQLASCEYAKGLRLFNLIPTKKGFDVMSVMSRSAAMGFMGF